MLYGRNTDTNKMMCGTMDGMCMAPCYCMPNKSGFSVIRHHLDMRMCM